VKKWIGSAGRKEPLHKKHVKSNPRALHNEIKIGLHEKHRVVDIVIPIGFGKQHPAEEESVTRVVQKFLVAAQYIIRGGKKYHHE
jgi:hypothetical protein